MRRRKFLGLVRGVAVVLPHVTRAQPVRRHFRIGYLAAEVGRAVLNSYFAQEMEKLGYVEGIDFSIEWRFADWNYDRLPALALELSNLRVDVIVATTNLAVRAAQSASREIPIVMAVSNDPVRMGLVDSLARPGGNTTGLSSANDEAAAKQLHLLTSMVPNLARVGHLINAARPETVNPYLSKTPTYLQVAAQRIGIAIQRIGVANPNDFENTFSKMSNEHMQAFILDSNYLFNAETLRIAKLALTWKLPSISQRRGYAEAGGLMSYGESAREFVRRTAYFVDKILKGARPADLPVELPTRFELVINRKTANLLELTIPTQLLTIADGILE